MLILTSILLVTFGVLSSATEDDICKTGPSHCFVNEIDVDYPDSQDEALDKICPIVIPRLKCLVEFKNKCDLKDMPPEFEVLDNIYDLAVEACDKESKLHKELALHLPCIEKNLMGLTTTCKPIVKQAIDDFMEWEEEGVSDPRELDNYMCLYEAVGISCVQAFQSVRCGEKAGELIKAVVDQIGYLDVICPDKIGEHIRSVVASIEPVIEVKIATEDLLSKVK